MTIPSRPAPGPPRSSNNSTSTQPSRYTPTTNWDDDPFDSNGSNHFYQMASTSSNSNATRKQPPPRPPPPRLKKPGQPTSINILSNIFGKSSRSGSSSTHTARPSHGSSIPPKLPAPPSTHHHFTHTNYGTVSESTVSSVELISFDSPPHSPTLTQKSHSDCTSIGSSSSDNNWSPHNGHNSQSESGFEDDFAFAGAIGSTTSGYVNNAWDQSDPFTPVYEPRPVISQKPVTVGSSSFFMYDNGTGTRSANLTSSVFDDPLCNGKSLLPPEPMLSTPTIIKPAIKAKPKLPTVLLSKTKVQPDYGALRAPNGPPPAPLQTQAPVSTAYYDEIVEDAFAMVLYDFDALQDGDLSLRENEKVYLLKKINDEWYYGKNRRGCEGMFPSSYIDVKVHIRDAVPGAEPSLKIGTNNSKDKISPPQQNRLARALYDFNAETSEDLSLKENEQVSVLYAINDEWLYGKIGFRQGQFPANFIEYET